MRESTYFFKKNLYYLIGQLLFSLRPTPMMAPTDSFGGDLEPVAVQQLTRMDAVFLSMETPETPAHIGGLAILDPSTAPDGFDFEQFVEFLESRIEVCPRFMWTIQQVPFGMDRPYWVEGEHRSAREQVHRVAVPSPGGREELAGLVGFLFERPLDRTLPLWEMFFIEGLQGGRAAVLWKVHHCLLDGRSGAGIAEIMFDLSPQPADRPLIGPKDEAQAGQPASWSELTRSAFRNGMDLPAASLRHVGKAVGMAIDGHFGPLAELSSTLAPKTSFNGRVGAKRTIAWSTASLADAKAAKETLGVKLNDVILGITAEAIRGYLIGRDELPEQSLLAGVPVSTRQSGDQTPGNQITSVNVYWGTDLDDPIERIHAIHAAADEAKQNVEAHRNLDPMAILADAFLPGALQLFARGAAAATDSMPLPSNAVVSNVPMTPVPLYIAGARVAEAVPISLLAPTQGLNITVISYNGHLHFGITADPNLVPEPGSIAEAIPKALIDLQSALQKSEHIDL